MAVTDPRPLGTSRAIPDDRRRDDRGLRSVTHGTRPPTIGDKLNDVMRQRVQTTDAAARAMGVPSAELLAWTADAKQPDRGHEDALQRYLQVDGRQLRALILRGQMRRAQARIRH